MFFPDVFGLLFHLQYPPLQYPPEEHMGGLGPMNHHLYPSHPQQSCILSRLQQEGVNPFSRCIYSFDGAFAISYLLQHWGTTFIIAPPIDDGAFAISCLQQYGGTPFFENRWAVLQILWASIQHPGTPS